MKKKALTHTMLKPDYVKIPVENVTMWKVF